MGVSPCVKNYEKKKNVFIQDTHQVSQFLFLGYWVGITWQNEKKVI